MKLNNGLEITEIQIWPVQNAEVSRVKAQVMITFNNALRISGCRIIEGAKGLFLSLPSEKKPGADQWFPTAHILNRKTNDAIQANVIRKYKDFVKPEQPPK